MASTNSVLKSFIAMNGASLAADVNGPATDVINFSIASVHIQCGAGATGEFFVQVSNVPGNAGVTGNGPGASDWFSLPLVDDAGTPVTLAVSGSATAFYVNIQTLGATYMRVIYDRTSGTGTASAYVTCKGI